MIALLLVAAPSFSMVVQNGHTAEITAVDVTPDRKLVLSAGNDGLVKLWTIDGKLLADLEHESGVTALRVLRDGKRFVTGDEEGNVALWSIETKKKLSTVRWHDKPVRALDLHGQQLASVAEDGRLVLGTLALEKKASFNDKNAFYVQMTDVRFTADGKRVVTTARNIYGRKAFSVMIWDLASGKAVDNEAQAVSAEVNAVALGPDGSWFATAHGFEIRTGPKDESIKLWRTSDMKYLGGCDVPHGYPRSLAVAGDVVYGGNTHGEIAICRSEDVLSSGGRVVAPARVFRAHDDHVNVLTALDDRLLSAASSFFGEASGIALWSTAKPEAPRLERRFPGANGGAKELTWWPNGEGFTVAYSYPQSIAVSYALNGRAQDSYRGHKYELHAFEYDPSGPRVLTASHDMTARLWTISGVPLAELPHPGVVYAAKLTKAGDIVTGCGDGNVRVFSQKDLANPRVLAGHKGNVYSVQLVGDRMVTSGEDKTVRAWEDGKVVATYGPMKDSVTQLAVHDDIVYASTWHGDTLVLRLSKDGFHALGTRAGTSVVISSDGARVATRTTSTVFVYDAAGKKLREIAARSSTLAFSPDGRRLLVGSHDGSVTLHALTSSEAPLRYLGNGDEWLVFDDAGDFDASPRGAERVAMVSGTTAYRVEQFALQSNRPDRLLSRVAAPALIEHYARAVQRRQQKSGVQSAAFDLAVPSAALELGARKGDEQTVNVRCSDARLELGSETLFVNGVPVSTTQISGRAHAATRTITLANGDNAIEVSCTNRRGIESFRAGQSVAFVGAKGRLFVATLGVSRYANAALNLGFAHQDATDVAASFAKRFSETKRFVRTDAQVNEAALAELRTFFAAASAGDTVVLFFAGHGLHDDAGTFFALPHEADTARLAETAFSFAALEGVLAGSRARNRLLLLDACESGESDELRVATGRGLAKTLVARGLKPLVESASAPTLQVDRDRYVFVDLERRSGTVVIASSRGDEWSFEDATLGHGLFTHGLLQALTDAKTDTNRDGHVSVHELERALRRGVREASGGRQNPMVLRDNPLSAVSF